MGIGSGAFVLAADPGTLGGSALASWIPLQALLGAYVVAVAALWRLGSPAPGDKAPLGALSRIGRGITRLTGIPGWAGIAIGQSLFALLVAGVGFYADVSWHIALGRDDELFTAPHTAILLGLVGILGAAVFGAAVATVDGWEQGWRIGGIVVPWSLLPLGALGLGAVSGFPMDEVWHAAYGVDVTMWSPTHMLMILGASFTGLAGWLVLADTGIRPTDSRWARVLHGIAAWLALQGLVASQGEFSFGVPQFPQVFQPLLISMAAGLGLVSIRLALGPGRALLLAAIFSATQFAQIGDDSGPVATRHGATFVASAVTIEVIARLLGTERAIRFAVACGIGIGTVGLAGEWVWNAGAFQGWNESLLPYAVPASAIGAVGTALLGVGFATAFDRSRTRIRGRAIAVGLVLAVAPVLAFLGRQAPDTVTAAITILPGETDDFAEDAANLRVELTPADAAADAHWFQATAWQGGGLVLRDLVEVDPGVWETTEPVPVSGFWKTLVRLHRNGTEMLAAPVWFPDDPTIGEPEIAAVDRTVTMGAETEFLLRETTESGGLLPVLVHGYLAAVLAAWFAAFVIGVRRIGGASPAVVAPTPTDRSPQPV